MEDTVVVSWQNLLSRLQLTGNFYEHDKLGDKYVFFITGSKG